MSEGAIPDTTEALVLLGPNEFDVREVPVPEPVADEVLCEVHSVALCGTDKELIEGNLLHKGWPRGYPYTPGHEWSGVVVSAGEMATTLGFEPGDRVAGTAHDGCGVCRMCAIGRYTLCDNYGHEERGHHHYGHYSTGAMRGFHASSVKSVFRVPDSMTLEQAALVDASSIALHAVKRSRVTPGDVGAVIGPGAQGLLAGQLAGLLGASRVIMVGRGGERLVKAEAMGFEVVDVTEVDGPSAVKDLTDGSGSHFTIDTAARGTSPADAVMMTRKGGRVALIGVPLEPCVMPLQKIVFEEIDVVGVRANPGTCAEVIPLIAEGRLDVDSVITHTFPLTEFGQAFETFTRRIDGAIKVLIQPQPR